MVVIVRKYCYKIKEMVDRKFELTIIRWFGILDLSKYVRSNNILDEVCIIEKTSWDY
jgi:hypothetical protein